MSATSATTTREYVVEGYQIKVAPTVTVFQKDVMLSDVSVILNSEDELQQVICVYGPPEVVEEKPEPPQSS